MLSSLLSPLRSGVLLAVLLLLAWRWLPRWSRMVASALLLLAALLTTPWLANQLVALQEARGHAGSDCSGASPSTIVVLGGGMRGAADSPRDWNELTHASLSRVFAAEALWRAHPGAPWVISGNGRQQISESALMGSLAIQLGVPEGQIRLEQRSRTTWQNARFVAQLEPAIPARIWLVTSALHMARARYAFQQAGFEVCAAPAESQYAPAAGIGYYLPATLGLAKADAAIREFVGEWAYRNGWLRDLSRDPHSGAGEP